MCYCELAAVDMDLLQKTTIDQDEVSELAPHFTHTFEALLAVMTLQEKKLQDRAEREAKEASQAAPIPTSDSTITTSSQKRTRSTSLGSLRGKRPKKEGDPEVPEQPTTPDQPTNPVNPDYTSSSLESRAEPDSQKLLEDFLRDTLRALMKDVRLIRWQRSGHKVEIAKTYASPGLLNLIMIALTR